MSREEDLIRSTTRAIAATVREVPPLRLEPAADELRSPARGRHPARSGNGRPRRWWSWGAPLTAAAVVVALAISLVIVRDLPNGSVVPPVPSASAAGPDGVPRYYAALDQQATKTGAPNALLVGDALTGKAIASFAPPAGTSFQSVSGAADDRTFVVLDVRHPGNSPSIGPADRWYEVELAPGTAHPATMTELPVESGFTQVIATALSGSGQELAVAGVLSGTEERGVEVFSLTTGQLLHDASTRDATALIPASWLAGHSQFPLLTWVDGDRAITFTTISQASAADPGASYKETVRRLNVGGPRSGDLMADSQVIWSASTASDSAEPPCEGLPPLVSADGKAISCFTLSLPANPTATEAAHWTLTFRTYHLSAPTTAAGLGTIAYQVTEPVPDPGVSLSAALWTSPSGATLIGEWAVGSGPSATATPSPGGVASASATMTLIPAGANVRPAHIGVISHGKFTPLRLPPGLIPVPAPDIAW